MTVLTTMNASGTSKGKRSSFSATAEQVYTCCCGLHVKQGVQVIAAFFILCVILFPMQFFDSKLRHRLGFDPSIAAKFILDFGLLFSEAFCAALVFVAIRCEAKKLLLPFMYSQYFAMAFSLAMAVIFIFDVDAWLGEFRTQIDNYGYHKTRLFVCIGAAIGCLIHILIRFWIAGIVKKCYQYLADMEKASKVEKLPRF
ncbi:unnamed protein product, partial [Mesorhabditis belari]|uniref:Uncharacterized protein n=1 Tax=Mesorhabditis belari TaxID=2138241 RepID=A0AAF3F3V6_9BILA